MTSLVMDQPWTWCTEAQRYWRWKWDPLGQWVREWATYLEPAVAVTELLEESSNEQSANTTQLALEYGAFDTLTVADKPKTLAAAPSLGWDVQPVTHGYTPSRQPQASGNASPIIIAIFGRTGTGKTTLIKNLSGKTSLKVGRGMKSTTKSVEAVDCKINNQDVTLVDTPGFDDTDLTDTQVLTKIAEWLKYYHDENKVLSGLIFLHAISDIRMSGSSVKNLHMFRKLCGDQNLRNVTLATTMWSEVSQETGLMREAELHNEFWKKLTEQGSRVDRVWNDPERDKKLVLDLAPNQCFVLQLQSELAQGLNLTQTQVGAVLNAQLAHLVAQYTKNLERAQREMRSNHDEEVKALKRKLDEMKADQSELFHRRVATIARVTRSWWQCSWRCVENCHGVKTKREGLWTCWACGREQNNVRY